MNQNSRTPRLTRRAVLGVVGGVAAGLTAQVAAAGPFVVTATPAPAPSAELARGVLSVEHPAGGTVQLTPEENRLSRERDGVTLWSHTGFGAAPFALNRPRGLAVQPDGTIVVANTGSGELLRYDADGTPRDRVGGLFGPRAVVVTGAGELLVAETLRRRVLAFDAALRPLGVRLSEADGLTGPTALAVAPDGTLVVAELNARRLLWLAPGATRPTMLVMSDMPRALAFEQGVADPCLLVALGRAVHRVDAAGRLRGTLAVDADVRGLSVSAAGRVSIQVYGSPA